MATGSSDLHLVVILVLALLVVPSMNRTCGGCTLRCKLLPVRELKKLANTRCQHQRAEICKNFPTPFTRAMASRFWGPPPAGTPGVVDQRPQWPRLGQPAAKPMRRPGAPLTAAPRWCWRAHGMARRSIRTAADSIADAAAILILRRFLSHF
jgi:hypothetical protein